MRKCGSGDEMLASFFSSVEALKETDNLSETLGHTLVQISYLCLEPLHPLDEIGEHGLLD